MKGQQYQKVQKSQKTKKGPKVQKDQQVQKIHTKDQKYNFPCDKFLTGACPYGEKCSFIHPKTVSALGFFGKVSKRFEQIQEIHDCDLSPMVNPLKDLVSFLNPNGDGTIIHTFVKRA